jgi:mannan endo-1,4-beta-mannosidase
MPSTAPGSRLLHLPLVLAWAALVLGVALALAVPQGAQARRSQHLAGLASARALTKKAACPVVARRNLVRMRSSLSLPKRCGKSVPAPAVSPHPLYWGAWIGDQLTGDEAPWDMGAVTALEKIVGKSPSLLNFSSPFADCSKSPCSFYDFPAAEMERIRSHGQIPFFSWASQSTPAGINQPDFQLSDVIEGRYDGYIREWAEAAKAWGHPFFLRFNWEMNGNWFAWMEGVNGNQPGEYVTAWRHVHDIFTSVGANNVTWVWCPNVDPGHKLRDLKSLYPGDAYVDWTGLDGYNFGTNPASPRGWMSFNELFRTTYDEIVEEIAPGKPLVISEVGSSEDGGSKAEWIADALRSASTEYPQLKGMIWFEKYDDGMDWPIETSSSSAAAFASGIQGPSYLGGGFSATGGGPVPPAA